MSEDKETDKVNETVFGPETEFDGELEFTDKLVITGKFNGKIQATGDLEIAKNAVCTVEKISARSIVISGSVQGNLEASERVEICSGSTVIGDITTARIRIASNVNFEGQVTMIDKEPDIDLFTAASAEYKKAMTLHSDVIQ
ncbi:MAG TPA: polymer-forming cytoskeletal protein [Treponema sp.]|nr:polymer-forming cytoskeletal protein [Treponema sp.]